MKWCKVVSDLKNIVSVFVMNEKNKKKGGHEFEKERNRKEREKDAERCRKLTSLFPSKKLKWNVYIIIFRKSAQVLFIYHWCYVMYGYTVCRDYYHLSNRLLVSFICYLKCCFIKSSTSMIRLFVGHAAWKLKCWKINKTFRIWPICNTRIFFLKET